MTKLIFSTCTNVKMNLVLIVVLKANLESSSPPLVANKPSTFTFYVNHNNFILSFIIWLLILWKTTKTWWQNTLYCHLSKHNFQCLFLKPHNVWRVDEWGCHSEYLAQEHRGPREEAFPYTNLSISMLLKENWNLVWFETRFKSTYSTHKPNIISCVLKLMHHQLKFAMWSENTSYLFIFDN
jgi:hypothetical protein